MFSYLGSKARLAPTYQAPRHDLIVEPFAGAAGYSMYWLQRRSALHAVLVDSDPVVAEIWDRLLGMDPGDLWDYPVPHQGTVTTDPLYLTAAWSTGSWGRYKNRGDFQVTERQARAFAHERRGMAHVLSVIQGRVEIIYGDYRDSPGLEATWFIDPPYQTEGHQYNSGNHLDWPTLGAWCRDRLGQVIVCESQGADWMDFTPHATTQTLAGHDSVEVVWYSDPEPTLLDLMQ